MKVGGECRGVVGVGKNGCDGFGSWVGRWGWFFLFVGGVSWLLHRLAGDIDSE